VGEPATAATPSPGGPGSYHVGLAVPSTVGWGEQSEPQRPCPGPAAGCWGSCLTPTYSPCGAVGWISEAHPPRGPARREGSGVSTVGWGEQSEPQRAPPTPAAGCWGSLLTATCGPCGAAGTARRSPPRRSPGDCRAPPCYVCTQRPPGRTPMPKSPSDARSTHRATGKG
jgi:hypothetical protein